MRCKADNVQHFPKAQNAELILRENARRVFKRYKYYHYCVHQGHYLHLPPEYNTIVVVVKFTTQRQADGALVANNFVITAWATYIFREG